MKHTCLLLALLVYSCTLSAIVKVTFPDDFRNGWEPYIGQTIEFTHPMVVVGVWYDSLTLSPERLYVPEEHAEGLADGDSTAYWRNVRYNRSMTVKLTAPFYGYKVRTGSVIRRLRAKVTGERCLLTGTTPSFAKNTPPRCRPCMSGTDMVVCAANIQNFFTHLGGYAGAKTAEQQALQTLKIVKGLRSIRADLYALCEVEKGHSAPQALCDALNAEAGRDLYAFVDNGFTDADKIMCCFVYRKDRLRPYAETRFAYQDTVGYYHYRMMVNAFEHLRTGERFVVNLNHLRSKRGDAAYSNAIRMANTDSILTMLDEVQRNDCFGDSDILMVGDFNCYTKEQPLQHIVRHGYADQLMRFAPDGYSYVYRGEIGYLDRVFASPSMATQIVKVRPYHLNADTYYSCGYKRGLNNTMYRYSDHDPILIGIRFNRSSQAHH